MIRLSSIWQHSRPVSLRVRGISSTTRRHHFALNPNTRPSHNISSRHQLQNDQRMSSTVNGNAETFANFDLIKRVALDYTDVVVSKWQSRVTGLSVVHLDFEGEHNQLSAIDTSTDSVQCSAPCKWLLCRWDREYVETFTSRAMY